MARTEHDPCPADLARFIYVDVEARDYVKVYGSPAMDDTDFTPRDFEGGDAFDEACSYAKREARRLTADWGHNEAPRR